MRRILIALIGVLSLIGIVAAVPVDASPKPREQAVIGDNISGTRIRTLECTDSIPTAYTMEIVSRVRGVKGLGTGTTVARMQITFPFVVSGTWTFTSDDGSNTLNAVHSGQPPLGGIPYDTGISYPTSGTGRFANVTGGELTIGVGPHINAPVVPDDCGRTWVENTFGFVDGFLTYNG